MRKKQDSDLFLEAIGKVTPIKSDKRSVVPTQKPKPYPKKKTTQFADKLTLAQSEPVNALYAEDTFSYTASGLQKNVLKKMRRGHYGLDAELDLHSLTSAEAKRELVKFLHYCEQDGCRCVRIIHGKGYRSENNLPVLKNDLNIWLRQHQEVQAFCSTAQKDGGAGAVFVLLRLSGKYADQDDT
ncbi:DNA mismatch repair protein MutS [Methylococcaceae bacterium HT4]|nr:Smr/MutS family protein [Methyloprofundus sp.]TXK96511.1 DNA mismatch repair protein MutS [Methylococcaceae bacterium CS5]TXK99427.1 DNA mismatch repair protein MutS [Methylococcaceae bacterium CS4]TXL03559.1 DNA mismatch repair protein MutS [Methylococcaceae bacterium CS3]TXL05368.1 DNA mismatch repair protein MutS [Methylococcaceae bacterium CS1]TXL10118.1 DNA mismatch repair protein MutS [Methylococcaceae bacterium CS2]TXL13889.1 DNA mismatch repair protein MutS [Methylococcaceae bacter